MLFYWFIVLYIRVAAIGSANAIYMYYVVSFPSVPAAFMIHMLTYE